MVASFDGAAVDPLREALAALDDKDYATAQRLFAAIGRKDVAEAIKDALAALDRKDYATAQGLFEALGQKGAAAAQVKGSATASPASPKPAAWAGGSMASDSRNKARQKPVTSPFEVIPLADAAYRRPLPQAEKAKSRRLKPLLAGTGLVLFAIFGVSAIYGSPLNWTFPTMKSQAIAGLSSAADVLKGDLEAITRQSAREEERPAAKPEVAGALVDPAAAARVDEDLDYLIAQRRGSVEGWRSFLAAHGTGVHAQSAREEVEKLLLAEKAPTPPGAEVSNGASTDAKAVSEVMVRPRLPRGWRSRLLRLTKSANVTGTVWNGCAAAPRATRLRASRKNWAARSCDPSSWVSWGAWATRPPRRPPRRSRMARRCTRKLGPRSWVQKIIERRRRRILKSHAGIPWRDTHWLIPG